VPSSREQLLYPIPVYSRQQTLYKPGEQDNRPVLFRHAEEVGDADDGEHDRAGKGGENFLVVVTQQKCPDAEGADESQNANVDGEERGDDEHCHQCDQWQYLDIGHGLLSVPGK